ncbi:MaoC family dehydratase [Rhodococcus sp. NPDC057297]|uniref:MaoC family dehydratase n=1 Tax=Rhodococcus sp. NPDC057297 TaxID=3346090 RepID=UPI00364176BD
MNRTTTLAEGQTLPTSSFGPVTQTDIVRFAGAGGDFNPLHHDADYAQRAGLPGVIAMGQMQAGILAAWLSDAVHIENVLAYSVRFASPLAIGEILELSGTVESVVDGAATLVLLASVGDRAVVHGKATVRTD